MLVGFMWVIIPTVTKKSFESNDLLWFMYLYSVAGYVRLYGDRLQKRASIYLFWAMLSIVFIYSSVLVLDLLGLRWPGFAGEAIYFYGKNKLPTALASLFIFLGFRKLDIGHHRFINLVSSTTFGIYIIHEHPLLRDFWWVTVFKNATFSNSPYLIPYSILAVILVFTMCLLVEVARQKFIEKPYFSFVERQIQKLLLGRKVIK
ncbi:hypothetical protein [Streptococcus cuniculi]|uniref:Acyltransferase 3 domain-containing protein n=1 Tax=Streptococcus cuniculi TaxID=1432788 RepID=A0A4Y9J822_9STRE|nr:hypothetical protein [Streptococcus cuniculi]MBF0778898.1 hypothetical protein [Streptococcus cuniculi]TFU97173.1 hypothetical protein E4T82_09230 [Streptococcus cuniculi]